MHVLSRQHELIADNLANINTAGHRRAEFVVSERSRPNRAKNYFGYGPEIQRRTTNFSSGKYAQTGRKLDVAISGDGFFVLQAPGGRQLFTRNGQFYRDGQSGELRNDQNLPVLGEGGPIQIDPTIAQSQIKIADDGSISADGQQLGQLRIAAFRDNNALIPVTQSVFRQSRRAAPREADVQVQQGFRELSNVNPTTELIGLIIGGRQYDAVQKATKMISEAMQESIRS